MTELRLRLIKDGKIVGHQWLCQCNHDGFDKAYKEIVGVIYGNNTDIMNHYSVDNCKTWGDSRPLCDSFDLGIRVNDEWWYENDIVEWENSQGKSGTCRLTVSKFAGLDMTSRYEVHPIKSIGNIYEGISHDTL